MDGALRAVPDFGTGMAGRVIFVGRLLLLSPSDGRLLAVTRLIAVLADREVALVVVVGAVAGFDLSV